MGGTKKKSLAAMEKEQESRDSGEAAQKPKKGEKQKAAGQQKRLPFLVPETSSEEMLRSLTQLKAITVYGASRVLGVNASIATGLLRNLESEKMIARVGGFSGHYVWAVVGKP